MIDPWSQRLRSVLSAYKHLVLLISVIGILIDIFVFDFTSDLIILFLTGLWVLVVWLYKFEGRVSIGIALGFLVLCPFLLIFNKEPIAEKAAIWAYMFLVVGVIQQIIEYRRERREDNTDSRDEA